MRVIFFDGVCNLCNGAVNWIIDHDKKNLFKFSSLQSDYSQNRLTELNLKEDYLNTIVLEDNGKVYLRSTAVLRIISKLGSIYSLAIVLLLIPPFIRNFIYNRVAHNRYRWFGKRDACRLPTPDLKSKFLE